jgi:conjugal transfer pilus assembly protein TraW
MPSWFKKSQEIMQRADEEIANEGFDAPADSSSAENDDENTTGLPQQYQYLKPKVDKETRAMAQAISARAETIRNLVTTKKMSADDVVKEMKKVPLERTAKAPPAETDDAKMQQMLNTNAAYIFVSQSMPAAEIRAALQMSSETGAIVVVRGIMKGQPIDQVAQWFSPYMDQMDAAPTVAINPVVFKEFDVQSVPMTLVRYNGKAVKVKGIIDVDYLLNQIVESGKEGDLPQVGPTYEIAEPDMVDEIQRRIAKIDWEKEKKGAVDRMWTNGHWKPVPLPTQEKTTTRMYDPSVVYTETVYGPGNKVVIPAGTKINPLDHVQMQGHLIVFDGTDKKQMAQVKQWMKDHRDVETRMLIASNMDVSKGLAGMVELRNYFGMPVMLLQPKMVERFDIRRVPYIAYSSGNRLVIHELGSKD